MNSKNKAVFLDRDGTINVEKHYLYRQEDFEYIPGVVDALRKLQKLGYILIIISNQSGIARGYYTEDDYARLDEWMKEDLKQKGIDIAASYYCPHHPEAKIAEYRCVCKCRKPGTELFWRAKEEYNIDMDVSFAIGDKLRDLAICKESDVKGILLTEEKVALNDRSITSCPNWQDVIRCITLFRH
ncbi:MAG: HAD family hydrolase [Lachnospiraceae bacterium]|nr:HAD family hydrolase [Lachnospiraceae bacterium]